MLLCIGGSGERQVRFCPINKRGIIHPKGATFSDEHAPLFILKRKRCEFVRDEVCRKN